MTKCHLGECSTAACTSSASTLDGTVCRRECPLNCTPIFTWHKVTLEKVSLHLSTLFTIPCCCIWSTGTKLIAAHAWVTMTSSYESAVCLYCIVCHNSPTCCTGGIHPFWDAVWFSVCQRKWSIPLHAGWNLWVECRNLLWPGRLWKLKVDLCILIPWNLHSYAKELSSTTHLPY